MGRYRGGSKSWEQADAAGRTLDSRQFPELSAVFYTADPSEFIKMRVKMLSLMGSPDVFLAPAFAIDRRIGSMAFGGSEVPSHEERQRYLRTEAVTVVHHASEALLRLFFAHVDHPECPWLSMSSSLSPREFKEQVEEALNLGFKQPDIAQVFLGGSDPDDAGIEMTAEDFTTTVESLEMLLVDCAWRFTGDAFLYNAVKHGLSAIDLDDEEAKMEWEGHDGQRLRMHKGPLHVYLHRKLSPNAKVSDGQWFLGLDDPNPQRDMMITSLITYAIDSLWAVARRQYLGTPGSVWFIGKGSIELALYAPIEAAANLVRRVAHELVKVRPDGDVDGTNHHISIHHIPDDWNLEEPEHQPAMRPIDLPLRERDRHTPTASPLAYLPIVPRGFAQGS
ncbi:hypothetical protein [Mycolicibacterium psychrotolerans]|uniref:Uncharacterized protein n=1 Tax=Mycolicibacterium psychrotolerans TaxID=216929 RepID=A0A7I7MCF2_9MYCO|nr:hypothetical protein [Mycolicibacterium psychrotolerans]BBX69716.1 hypothetical protein MPSYJ_31770 [Mycolicibacterium psychrotolerans]